MPSMTSTASSQAPLWRRPLVLAAAVVVVIAAGVTAWFVLSDSERDQYCEDLRAWHEQSQEPIEPGADVASSASFLAEGINRRIDGAKKFSEEAPEEVRGDWELFHGRLQDVIEVFTKLGYDLTDPAAVEKFATDLQGGALTEISPELQAEAAAVQAKLADSEATSAITSITDDAQAECDLDLNLSTSAVQ